MGSVWRGVALGGVLVAAGLAWGAEGDVPDVQTLRQGLVGIKVEVNPRAHSAATLGEHRKASGVVIGPEGLIVTVGYIILEAHSVEITGPDGTAVPGAVVGYHAESGFGLVRPLRPLKGAVPVRLGRSDAVSVKDPVLILTHGGDPFTSALVVSRRTFTGYWEYILENALYTVPAIPNFAGAALVDREFALIGVGSLFVNNAVDPEINVPGNLFIPIDALKPILPDLVRNGRAAGPARPWLGVNVIEQFGRVVIVRVTKEGPAERAGLGVGDLIFEVAGQRVNSAEEFFRAVWRQGHAGVAVPLKVLQQHSVRDVSIPSGDRYQFYRVHPLD